MRVSAIKTTEFERNTLLLIAALSRQRYHPGPFASEDQRIQLQRNGAYMYAVAAPVARDRHAAINRIVL